MNSSPPLPVERTVAFHNEVFKRFLPLSPKRPAAVVDFTGGVHNGHDLQMITMSLGEGLTLGGRSLENMMIVDVRNSPRGEIVVVGDSDFLTVNEAIGMANISRYGFFLDPAMNYLPVGYEVRNSQGQRTRAGTLEYEPDPEIGFRPTGGTRTYFNGETQEITSDRIIEVEYLSVNIPIPAWRFEVDFPEGTSVVDNIAGIKYTIGLDDPETLARMPPPEPTALLPEATPVDTPAPPPPILIDPVSTDPPADNFARIGLGITLFISGLAFLFLYRSMKK